MSNLKTDVNRLRDDIRRLLVERMEEIQDKHEVGIPYISVDLIDVTTMDRLSETGCHKYHVGEVTIDLEV